MLAFDFIARALEEGGGRRWAWLGAAAVMWGLATLTRGLTLYFLPLLALWLGWVLWRENKKSSVWRAAILPAVVFGLVVFAVIAPYTARNYFQFHQFVLLETKGGVNLWLGNSPYTPYEFIRNVWKVGVREPMLNALVPSGVEGLPQNEIARDRAAYALALNYMRAEPLAVLARVPGKFADFWGFERNLVDVAEATRAGGGWNSLSKTLADLYGALAYMFIALGGLAGWVYARNDAWKILFGGFILYFVMIHLVIFGDGRFHLPLIPLLAMYAAWLATLYKRIAYPRARTVGFIIGASVLVAVWAREAWAAWNVLSGGH
jgi:4-amino-4-deoxy-L-arabinose transferase-like glycosyltransferase